MILQVFCNQLLSSKRACGLDDQLTIKRRNRLYTPASSLFLRIYNKVVVALAVSHYFSFSYETGRDVYDSGSSSGFGGCFDTGRGL